MRESAYIFIPFKSLTKNKTGAHLSSLIGPNSPREAPNTHYMMLHRGLFPRLTTEVVPQGLDTIKTSHKEENTCPMGVQKYTMIIHIIISSEVTNTSTHKTKQIVIFLLNFGMFRMLLQQPFLFLNTRKSH